MAQLTRVTYLVVWYTEDIRTQQPVSAMVNKTLWHASQMSLVYTTRSDEKQSDILTHLHHGTEFSFIS